MSDARDAIALLRGLRATRDFTDQPIPQAVIDDIADVSRWTGSASNRQPWHVVIVRDRETLRRIAAAEGHCAHAGNAAAAVVIVLDNERPELEAYDDGRLSERIMLAAAAHGIGSCIGFLVGGGRDEIRRLLGAPESALARTVISLGYRDMAAHASRPKRAQVRKPSAEIIHFDRI
ncbi:MAG: nitroreductase family protein [Chloroflexota bacterium]